MSVTWDSVPSTVPRQMHMSDLMSTLVRTMAANGARCVLVSGGFSYFTSRVAKGTAIAFDEQRMAVDIFVKAPDKRVSVMHMKEGESVTAYNGKVGWLSVPGHVHILSTQESFAAKMDADVAFAADVKSLYSKWETLPGEKIDGRDTWLVKKASPR